MPEIFYCTPRPSRRRPRPDEQRSEGASSTHASVSESGPQEYGHIDPRRASDAPVRAFRHIVRAPRPDQVCRVLPELPWIDGRHDSGAHAEEAAAGRLCRCSLRSSR
ncbi:hypothetical protein ABZT45_46580 [Streptomyces sp. NPDC005356]|uniref:hypothetical protein n=1 Tax=unclassified Streptomyces TaxID=2593676 RepID=UPI0033ACB0EF